MACELLFVECANDPSREMRIERHHSPHSSTLFFRQMVEKIKDYVAALAVNDAGRCPCAVVAVSSFFMVPVLSGLI